MTEQQKQQEQISNALQDLKRAREELRVKLNLLGKDARGMVADAENRVKKVEARIVELGEVMLKEVSAAIAYLREKLGKVKEPEKKEKNEKTEEKKPEGRIGPPA